MKNIFDLACFLLFYCFIFSMLSVFLMGLFCIGAYYVFFITSNLLAFLLLS